MKNFESIKFNRTSYVSELTQFKQLLDSKDELSEKDDILPFFKSNRQIAAEISSIYPLYSPADSYATELDLFGDFKADLVIGNKIDSHWIFIEFESALKKSIFQKVAQKSTTEYSPKFEHGYSQIVDWFYKMDDMKQTSTFQSLFGQSPKYSGLLIIGRDKFLSDTERKRLEWRITHTKVHSQEIGCMTYDKLYESLQIQLKRAQEKAF